MIQHDITPEDLKQADKDISELLNPDNKHKKQQEDLLKELWED